MKITLTVKDSTARYWLYLLRKAYKSKAGLERLLMAVISKKIAELSTLEIEENGYASLVEKER